MSFTSMAGQRVIEFLVGQGWGATAITNEVKRIGYSYRRQDMLADIRKFNGRQKFQTQIETLNSDKVIPTNYISKTPSYFETKYRVFGNAEWEDVETGDRETRRFSMYTDYLGSKDDYEVIAIEGVEIEKYGFGQQLINFSVTGVEQGI